MSVFLSFGLPNPELVIRLNRVTEQTDVHSSMNQLLWAIQREEVVGVQHFLQTREVRADDLYGAPAFGFTPLRLALDRKSEKLARLLYHSGGFHGTLPGSAASSLLLWIEQDPTAVDTLVEHFPVSDVIDEAEYTTLHKIIMGLRHLDLHEYLRTPEGLALVNQPNAHGRTPLHVAALRGDADAIEVLLDAGADLDARGNHNRHAMHYACKAGSIDAVEVLLARGASLHVCDKLNRKALFELVAYGSNTNPDLVTKLLALGMVEDPDEWVTTTLLALTNNRIAAVERLLPYWPPTRELPLYPAIHIGSPDAVRLLLARGADYRAVDSYGEGILHWLAGSGLDMLRLFREIGVSGVDVGRTDNMGKTAVDIMEGRWDLTEEFRREFMELLDELRKPVVEEISDVEDEDGDVDEDLSEDIFFDAVDGSVYTPEVPEEQCPRSLEKEAPTMEPNRSQSPDCCISDVEVISAGATHQETPNYNFSRPGASGTNDEESPLQYKPETTRASQNVSIPGGAETEQVVVGEVIRDGEPKYPGSPKAAEDKVYTDEAGLKFLGTSAALRGQ